MMVHESILILGILGKISTSFVLCYVIRDVPHQLWWKNELMPGRPFITFYPMKEGLLLLGKPLKV